MRRRGGKYGREQTYPRKELRILTTLAHDGLPLSPMAAELSLNACAYRSTTKITTPPSLAPFGESAGFDWTDRSTSGLYRGAHFGDKWKAVRRDVESDFVCRDCELALLVLRRTNTEVDAGEARAPLTPKKVGHLMSRAAPTATQHHDIIADLTIHHTPRITRAYRNRSIIRKSIIFSAYHVQRIAAPAVGA